jgi:hypothetical protein
VRRGGEDFADTARALSGTGGGILERQPGDRWKWVSVKLNTKGKSGTRSRRNQVSHPEALELRQLAKLGR